MKHIEVHYHFVSEKILAREVNLIYVSTKEQVAGVFMKTLGIKKLHKFRHFLGVLEMDSSLRGEY